MALDFTREGFKEVGPMQGVEPVVQMPRLNGGISRAAIEASFVWDGKRYRVRNAEKFPNAKCRVVCLGVRVVMNGLPTSKPCEHKPIDVTDKGGPLISRCEAAIDAMVTAHRPVETQRSQEQHVLALFCDEPMNAAAYQDATKLYESRIETIKQARTPSDQIAIMGLRQQWGEEWTRGFSPPPPELEIIGLLSVAPWPSE